MLASFLRPLHLSQMHRAALQFKVKMLPEPLHYPAKFPVKVPTNTPREPHIHMLPTVLIDCPVEIRGPFFIFPFPAQGTLNVVLGEHLLPILGGHKHEETQHEEDTHWQGD